MGISVMGSRVWPCAAARQRMAHHPGQPADLDGERYLVAPRGVTQWVRNLRAVGDGDCASAGAARPSPAAEIADASSPADPPRYLTAGTGRSAMFFEGRGRESTESRLLRSRPAFRSSASPPARTDRPGWHAPNSASARQSFAADPVREVPGARVHRLPPGPGRTLPRLVADLLDQPARHPACAAARPPRTPPCRPGRRRCASRSRAASSATNVSPVASTAPSAASAAAPRRSRR